MKLVKLQEGSYDVPAKLQELIDEKAWGEAYAYAGKPEYTRENPGQTNERGQESVLNAFVKSLPIKEEASSVFKFICRSLSESNPAAGFSRRTNPFLGYLEMWKPAQALYKDQWIALNNLYANEVIDPIDFRGAQGKTEGILFNQGLFTNNLKTDDLYNLVEAYVTFEENYPTEDEDLQGDLQIAKNKIFYGTTGGVDPEKTKIVAWPQARKALQQLENSLSVDDLDDFTSENSSEKVSPEVRKIADKLAKQLGDERLTSTERKQVLTQLGNKRY